MTPTGSDIIISNMVGKCKVESCFKDNSKGGQGYCGMHWQRIKRGGHIDYICSKEEWKKRCREAQPLLGKCKKTTYKKLLGKHEHRVVVEQFLGRKLETHEHVHHIDGNKHNNKIENLAVVTRLEHLRLHGKNFTKEDILNIRVSNLTQKELARIYNCSISNISHIKRKLSYKEY